MPAAPERANVACARCQPLGGHCFSLGGVWGQGCDEDGDTHPALAGACGANSSTKAAETRPDLDIPQKIPESRLETPCLEMKFLELSHG